MPRNQHTQVPLTKSNSIPASLKISWHLWWILLNRRLPLNLSLIQCASYLPAIGRFLIVVTFLEDALRIVTQFSDQIFYLVNYRRFLPWGIAHLFLVSNVCVHQPSFGILDNLLGNVGWKLHGRRTQELGNWSWSFVGRCDLSSNWIRSCVWY